MTPHPQNQFQLGELLVSPSHNEIIFGEKRLTLQPKVMAVLHYLAQHQDRVVSGEELLAELWKGRIVTPGSVQKSINSLRKAFAEFCGDQEMIVHYSKRGYQLVIAPVFLDSSTLPEEDEQVALPPEVLKELPANPSSSKNKFIWAGLALILLVSVVFIIRWNEQPQEETPFILKKDHQTRFTASREFINNKFRESLVRPHPDNQHLAYVRQRLQSKQEWEIDSQLMIKNPQGEDWQIALSNGSWDLLAWSPDGQYLVAVERWRDEDESLTPDFYEISPYLYTFHIFSLDLNRSRLIEKFLLSQWQGRINSLTWWDKTTIEFVGTQGLSLKPVRYRYSVVDQELTEVDVSRSSAKPLLSQVKDHRTALVLQEKQEVRIELVDEQQTTRRSWQLEDAHVELGWVPDGSGVLVHLPLLQQLYLLYWDGERQDLDIKRPAYQTLLNPVYRPDGQALYYVLENRRQEVEWWKDSESFKSLYTNTDLATFSPDARSLVYAVEQGEEWHLWLQSLSGDLRQLTKDPLPRKPSHLSWSEDGRWLVYKIARQIWFYSIEDGSSKQLGFESSFIEPLSYLPDEQILLVVKTNGETRNLWSLNVSTLEQKQLTFGAVGTVAAAAKKFYFQYRAKSGLWAMDYRDGEPQILAKNLAANSRLVKVDEKGIYFVTGGYCRESAIQYLQLADGNIKEFWPRKQSAIITRDFHPQAGLLQTPCRLPASHILMAQ